MLFSPADFFNLYFSELDRLSIPYVVLHSYDELPDKITSDIDYAVLLRDLPRLAGIQRRLAESCGAVLAHTIEAHIHALYTVVIDPTNPASFLQLDACGHYVERDCRLLQDRELLKGRRKFKDFFVPAPEIEFSYLLAKALAKGTPLAPRFPVLRELWLRFPTGAQTQFAKLTGDGSSFESWIARPADDWMQLRNAMLRRHRAGVGDRLREGLRKVRRVVEPKGFHIGLIGGSAESRKALRDRVGPVLEQALFRRQVCHDYTTGTSAKVPPQPLCCTSAWLWRFTRQYFKTLYPAKVRNELIMSEGGAGDLVRYPASYGISNVSQPGRLLASCVPKPDLTVFLPTAAAPLLKTDSMTGNSSRVVVLSPDSSAAAQAKEILTVAIQLLRKREEQW